MAEISEVTFHKTEKQALLLEEDIDNMEQELDRMYYQLGKNVYEIAEQKVDCINKIVDQIVATRLKLCGIRENKVCVHCLTQNTKESIYCCHCGERLDS